MPHAHVDTGLFDFLGDTVRVRATRAGQPIEQALLDRHFLRKHGPGAYYGQPPTEESP